jgi:hypothetical protein
MTANEWRFKMCVLARDEWRKNCDEYPGLCCLFMNIVANNGRRLTTDEVLNAKIKAYFTPFPHLPADISMKDLIPAFRRPFEANQRTPFWWPRDEKAKRLEFLNNLVQIYANLIDKEN